MKQMNVVRGLARAVRRQTVPMSPPSAASQAQMESDRQRMNMKMGRALFFSHSKAALPF